jgi:hypothetical protein
VLKFIEELSTMKGSTTSTEAPAAAEPVPVAAAEANPTVAETQPVEEDRTKSHL